MVSSEAPVIGRMPILGGQDEIETFHQPVYDRYYLVPVGYRQGTTWQEVVLYVDHEEAIHPDNVAQKTEDKK